MPKTYTAKDGDCISRIAFELGYFPDTLWDHADNAALKKLRKNPNVLLKGDKVVIPDKTKREESGAAEARHRFRRKSVPEMLRLCFLDDKKEPRADVAYTLKIQGGPGGFEQQKKKTDPDGCIEEAIPPDAAKATLHLGEGEDEEIYEFELGHLDPIDTISGVKARLINLGFGCGKEDGMDKRTMRSLRDFQKYHEMETLEDPEMKMDGDKFKPTLDKLEKEHAST